MTKKAKSKFVRCGAIFGEKTSKVYCYLVSKDGTTPIRKQVMELSQKDLKITVFNTVLDSYNCLFYWTTAEQDEKAKTELLARLDEVLQLKVADKLAELEVLNGSRKLISRGLFEIREG